MHSSAPVNWESRLECVPKGDVLLLGHFYKQECLCQGQRAVKVLGLMFQAFAAWLWHSLHKTYLEPGSSLQHWEPGMYDHAFLSFRTLNWTTWGNCRCKNLPKVSRCHTSFIIFFPVHRKLYFPVSHHWIESGILARNRILSMLPRRPG